MHLGRQECHGRHYQSDVFADFPWFSTVVGPTKPKIPKTLKKGKKEEKKNKFPDGCDFIKETGDGFVS